MKHLYLKNALVIFVLLRLSTPMSSQNRTLTVKDFEKVIVSPHIQVTFKEGDEASIIIEENKLPSEVLNVEVKSKTLHLYLDRAKISSPTKKVKKDGWMQKVPIYKGTIVKATVIYKKVKSFALRGEQKFEFKSLIKQEKLRLKIYGESKVTFNNLILDYFKVAIYGESYLKINNGTIDEQKFTAYGESKINTFQSNNATTRLTAYGSGSYRFNVSKKLKVTSFGASKVVYKGNATLTKGIVIGDTEIIKM